MPEKRGKPTCRLLNSLGSPLAVKKHCQLYATVTCVTQDESCLLLATAHSEVAVVASQRDLASPLMMANRTLPGCRRFCSCVKATPDQYFQLDKHYFWFFVYITVVDFVDGQSHRVQYADDLAVLPLVETSALSIASSTRLNKRH